MKDEQMVLVSDIDGTIIWFSLPSRVHHWMSRHRDCLILFLPVLPLAYLLYLFRPRKKSAKIKIRKHRQSGGRVVIFSATEDMCLTRWIIKAWLKIWGVRFDRLALRPHNEKVEEFKLRIFREEGCDTLLENEVRIIDYLIGESMNAGIRLIRIITDNGYSTIHFATFDPFSSLS